MDDLKQETKEVVYTMRMKNGHPKEIWGHENNDGNSLLFGKIDPTISYFRVYGMGSALESFLQKYKENFTGDDEILIELSKKDYGVTINDRQIAMSLNEQDNLNNILSDTNATYMKISRTPIGSEDRYDATYTIGIKN
ncbi:MAG: hypothetical protein GOU98_01755 [Candidatus Altiarchaeota archaeon]|nr:hypothetical protein [Candidatus Altiarchaeota archaeon]